MAYTTFPLPTFPTLPPCALIQEEIRHEEAAKPRNPLPLFLTFPYHSTHPYPLPQLRLIQEEIRREEEALAAVHREEIRRRAEEESATKSAYYGMKAAQRDRQLAEVIVYFEGRGGLAWECGRGGFEEGFCMRVTTLWHAVEMVMMVTNMLLSSFAAPSCMSNLHQSLLDPQPK